MILSTDLLLSLIVIVIIFGISVNTVDNLIKNTSDQYYRFNLERQVRGAADILINTYGTWNSSDVIPGLKKENSGNVLSFKKILKLKENYDELIGKILPNTTTSLILYPKNGGKIVIKDDPPISSQEVVVVNRTVVCDFFADCVVIKIDANKTDSEVGPIPSKISKHFSVTTSELNQYNYFLISNASNILWNLNTVENPNNDFNSEKFYNLNDRIKSMVKSEKQVIWLNLNSIPDDNVYIVKIKKSILLDPPYFENQVCDFVLKVYKT